mmetsp:Transcript_47628/g.70519  ORF Transcript_47628/g.70519 Transcript_47628/m.70519 type:complete len:85 (+) Transcript_47628:399-653(+)
MPACYLKPQITTRSPSLKVFLVGAGELPPADRLGAALVPRVAAVDGIETVAVDEAAGDDDATAGARGVLDAEFMAPRLDSRRTD